MLHVAVSRFDYYNSFLLPNCHVVQIAIRSFQMQNHVCHIAKCVHFGVWLVTWNVSVNRRISRQEHFLLPLLKQIGCMLEIWRNRFISSPYFTACNPNIIVTCSFRETVFLANFFFFWKTVPFAVYQIIPLFIIILRRCITPFLSKDRGLRR